MLIIHLKKFCFFIFVAVFILSNFMAKSIYYVNSTDNAVVWRDKLLKLPKLWFNYPLFGLQHCVSRILISETGMPSVVEHMMKCIKKYALRSRMCQQEKFNKLGTISQYYSCFLSPDRLKMKLKNFLFCEKKYTHTCMNLYGASWDNSVIKNISVLVHQRTKPSGKDCLKVTYGQNNKIGFINEIELIQFPITDSLQYRFNSLFGLNITFKTFLLSEFCFINKPFEESGFISCFYHKGTEYIIINQNEMQQNKKLYLCMKRPQFSIYTNQSIILEYFLCKYCVNYQSNVVFSFQVVDMNVFVTGYDNYSKIYYLSSDLNYNARSISCSMLFNICAQKVITYFLAVKKYSSIKILKISSVGRIFIRIKTHVVTELFVNSKSFTCEYFHCVLEAVSNNPNMSCSEMSTCDSSFLYFVKTQQYVNVLTFSDTLSSQMISEKSGETGQKMYNLNGKGMFFKITVKRMRFSGWKVPSCLYGGVSIYESDISISRETLSLCDDYVTINDSEKDSTPYSGTLAMLLMAYISVTDNVVIVLYHDSISSLDVELSVSLSNCKGVILNPCSRTTFLLNELHDVVFLTYLHFTHFNEGTQCVSLQFGHHFFLSENVFEMNLNNVLGCRSHYFLAECYPSKYGPICSGNVDFMHIEHSSNYISPLHGRTKKGHTFQFFNRFKNTFQTVEDFKSFNCKKSNIFWKGVDSTKFTNNWFDDHSERNKTVHVYNVTRLLIKDNPMLRGGQTIGLTFYYLHAVTISGTRKRL